MHMKAYTVIIIKVVYTVIVMKSSRMLMANTLIGNLVNTLNVS